MGRWNPGVDGAHAARTLSMAISHRTVSARDPKEMDLTPFSLLRDRLEQAYPTFFSAAHVQAVAGGSLLMLLPGAQKVRPLLFLGHLDVLPVGEDSACLWTEPPFSGAMAQGYVWGRGAWEGKGRLVALCEAAEGLLQNGWRPSADIWFAFSHDAKAYGPGAKQMCRILQAQGVEPAFILDGGGQVGERFAKVGVAEKGYADITLSVSGEGGDAAGPKLPTGLEELALAAARASQNPMKPRLCTPVEWMLKAMAPHMPMPWRLVYKRPRLFWPILRRAGGRLPRAEIVSTMALTQAKASQVADRLPRHTSLTYHCRILPGTTVEEVIGHLRNAAGPGNIRLMVQGAERPSGLSPASGPAWEALATAIQILFPHAVPVPCLEYHTTDARCYEELGGAIYRFSPFQAGPEEGPHPVDERISIENLELGIQFYQQMLQA